MKAKVTDLLCRFGAAVFVGTFHFSKRQAATQHEAVSQIETAETPPGSVVDVLQTGYRIGDRLLRPALVVVAKAPPPGAAGERGDGAAHADGEDGGEPAGPNGHDPDAA